MTPFTFVLFTGAADVTEDSSTYIPHAPRQTNLLSTIYAILNY